MTPEQLSIHITAAETEAKEIGLKLRQLRDHRGMTRTELSKRCGISKTNLFYIENGEHQTTFINVCRILAAMEYSMEDIIEPKQSQP